jgi:hypothetical protein
MRASRRVTIADVAAALAVLDEQRFDTVVCNVEAPEQRDHFLACQPGCR